MSDLLELLERLRPENGYVTFRITGSGYVVETREIGKPWNAVSMGYDAFQTVRNHEHASPKAIAERDRLGTTYGQQHPSHLSVFL